MLCLINREKKIHDNIDLKVLEKYRNVKRVSVKCLTKKEYQSAVPEKMETVVPCLC